MTENGNDNVSYRWVTHVLITIVGALLLLGIGWLKSSEDDLTTKVNNIPTALQGVTDGMGDLKTSVAGLQTHLDAEDAKIQKDHDDITALKSKVDIQQNWISAQVQANKARRELRRPPDDPSVAHE